MIVFWSVIAIMVLLAMAVIVLPVVHNPKQQYMSRKEINLTIYHERIHELQAELAQNVITKESYDKTQQQLAKALLDDIPEQKALGITGLDRKQTLLTIFISLVFVPVFSLGLYFYWGNSQQLAYWLAFKKNKSTLEKEIAKYKDPQHLIAKMKTILAEHPNSAKGWFLLGRLYMSTGQIKGAEQVFAKANQLKPNDSGIMLQYAEASFFANDKQLNQTAKKMLRQILAKKNEQPMALNLLAMDAYNHKQYKIAANYWERLLLVIGPDSDLGKAVQQAIAKAQQLETRS